MFIDFIHFTGKLEFNTAADEGSTCYLEGKILMSMLPLNYVSTEEGREYQFFYTLKI